MNKRAEELADKIWFEVCDRGGMCTLVDSELRKERERCAARFRDKISAWTPTHPDLIVLKQTLLTDGIAVILGEEDK